MSLESQVIDLIGEVRNYTGVVNAQIPQIRTEQTSFINNFAIDGNLVLTVGADKQYPSIQAAYDSLVNKTIAGNVLIKVSDGTYNAPSVIFHNHPYAHRISVEGNITNPAACVLNCIGIDKQNQGILFYGVRGISFSGFKITGGADKDVNFTFRGIRVFSNSLVTGEKNSIIIENTFNGLEVSGGSIYSCEAMRFNNVASNSVAVDLSSKAIIPNSIINGTSRDRVTTLPQGGTAKPTGIIAIDSSVISCDNSIITNCNNGVYSNNNSYIHAEGVSVDATSIGVQAESGSIIFATNSKVNNANSIAYYTTARGQIIGANAKAENSVGGFQAVTGGQLLVSGGWAKNCSAYGYSASNLGFIDANGTSANSTGTANKYNGSPTSGAFANGNGMIVFS